MAAVFRIKRSLNEDPLDTVLLNCKRRKIGNGDIQDAGDLSAVLKFAGTTTNPEEDVFKHIKKPTKAESEEQYKKHTTNVITKLRQQKQASSKNNRYKVVNSFRSNDKTLEQSAEENDLTCTIVDLETDENKENEGIGKSENNSNPQFVYDLYYTNSDDFGEADLNEFISVYPLSDGLIYDSQHDKYESDSENSEDSNAENNWRNDYPDESDMESPVEHDDESVTEVDMLRAMNKVALNDDEDLSSDDYDEAFGYDREDEYGRSYSRFKSKTQKLSNSDFCYYEDDYDDSCTP